MQPKSSATFRSSKCLRTLPKVIPHITNPQVDESDENDGEEEGRYVNEDGRLTKVLVLRVLVDTRWNSLYYMIERKELTMQYILFPAFLVYHATVLFDRPPCTYVKGKVKYIFVICVGCWLCGGPWRSTSKCVQRITENHC